MTTIAFKSGLMAADSFATDDCSITQVCKLVRLPKGDMAGGAGDLNQVAAALSWLAQGGEGDAPAIPEAAIMFTDGGVLHLASCGWPGIRVKGDCAIGSGAQGAIVAMRVYGATAPEAVASVIGVDPSTGGEIDVLAYEPPKKRSRRK